MQKVKKTNIENAKKFKPALTPEERENQMIALATDLAEQQLRDGTASSQIITELLKRGSTKAKLEKEILDKQAKLLEAKTENLKSSAKIEAMYSDAIKAMAEYSGQIYDDTNTQEDDSDPNIY